MVCLQGIKRSGLQRTCNLMFTWTDSYRSAWTFFFFFIKFSGASSVGLVLFRCSVAPAGFICSCCGFVSKPLQAVDPGQGSAHVAFQQPARMWAGLISISHLTCSQPCNPCGCRHAVCQLKEVLRTRVSLHRGGLGIVSDMLLICGLCGWWHMGNGEVFVHLSML